MVSISTDSRQLDLRQVPVLLRGEPEPIQSWIQQWTASRLWFYVAVICLGAGAFGAAMGSWRAQQQALYCALKLPLVLLLTTLGNGLLNGMLAQVMGLNLAFRQSLLSVLMSFTLAALILAGFSPLVWFLAWNTPSLDEEAGDAFAAYRMLLLSEVAIIAFAGVVANVRLLQLLRRLCGETAPARRILFSWLACNLLLGGQISWILRPFTGSPNMPVTFLRDQALRGNFFESIYQLLQS